MKANFDASSLEEFPKKHLFNSVGEKLSTRRVALERYLHSLFQDALIGCSELLKEFFIAVQKVISAYMACTLGLFKRLLCLSLLVMNLQVVMCLLCCAFVSTSMKHAPWMCFQARGRVS